jgi:hypothetical protein
MKTENLDLGSSFFKGSVSLAKYWKLGERVLA